MKHFTKLWGAILTLAAIGGGIAEAENISNYTVDFDTQIDTNTHDFIVAQKWKHVVDSYTDEYGDTYYMSYSWKQENGNGFLYCPEQRVGDGYSYGQAVYDLLVTPVISGQVSIDLKAYSSTGTANYIEVYELDETLSHTRTKIFEAGTGKNGNEFNLGSMNYTTVTFNVETPKRVALRCSRMYLDNFVAETAVIEPEAAMQIVSTDPPTTTSGPYYALQQPDGSAKFTFKVKVKNTGDLELTPGMQNYSVSVTEKNTASSGKVFATVNVPQTLQPGETSDEFEVVATFPAEDVASIWKYSYTSAYLYVVENISHSQLTRSNVQMKAWEPKFVFRKSGTSSTSSLATTSPINYSAVSGEKSYGFEILNNGTAPLTIQSITLPEGYAAELPETVPFQIAPDSTLPLDIAISATPGHYNGNLVIVYLDKSNAEQTYSMPLTGHKITEGTWAATFDSDNNTPVYPEGVVVESAYQTSSTSNSISGYNHWLRTYTNSSYVDKDNRFITPKLHAQAGDVIYFETSPNESVIKPEHGLKVYVSTDRLNWGEPVKTVMASECANNDLTGYTITFDTEGDYYLAFADFCMKLDNIIGLTLGQGAAHDLVLRELTVPETAQAGEEFSVSASFWRSVSAAADDYAVKVYANDEEVATINSVAITADPKNSTTFSTKLTLTPEVTTDYAIRIDLEFTDGTVVSSGSKTISVTYAPEFGFYKKDNHGSKWYHDSESAAIAFGKTNNPLVKEYEIYNWGSAPLQVKSFNLPAGFSTEASATTVQPKTAYPIVINFSATEAGEYSGNLEVTYVNAEGEDAVYTLAISGTMLDPNKWYATFDNGTTTGQFPAGSMHKEGAGLSNLGTGTAPNLALYATAALPKENMFITPKLHAEEGETLNFDAKIYSTGWKEGAITIFVAPTREELLNYDLKDEWTQIAMFSGQNEEEDFLLTTDFATYSVAIPAGDWYIGIQPQSRAYVDEIYGLKPVAVDHDLLISGTTLPTGAMQNNMSEAKVKITNLGFTPEAAEDYKVSMVINGEKITSVGTTEIPMHSTWIGSTATATSSSNTLKAFTEISVPFRYPKAGTFPVYAEVTIGDYSVQSEPGEITIAEETLSGEKTVGTRKEWSSTAYLNINYRNSEVLSIYTPEQLGLTAGDKIGKIRILGYNTNSWESNLTLAYAWTDAKTIEKPSTSDAYDYSNMIECYNGPKTWELAGSASAPIDNIVFDFSDQPLVYEAGKSLVILARSTSSAYKSTFNFEMSTISGQSYRHQNDGTEAVFTGSWSSNVNPVLHLDMVVDPASLSGTVTDREGVPVEGAEVLMVSTDGDNVQYGATTAADGTYAFNVIQNNRSYDLSVKAEGLEEAEFDTQVTSTEVRDYTLRPVFRISDDATHTGGESEAVVYLDRAYAPGFTAVTLPISLDAEEMTELFGEDAIVLEYANDEKSGAIGNVYFEAVAEMEAGTPYLIYLNQPAAAKRFHSKNVISDLNTTMGNDIHFVPTSQPTIPDGNVYLITDADGFQPAAQVAARKRAQLTIPAYSAYLKAAEGINALNFYADADVPTEVEVIEAETEGADQVYTIDGLRVKNPQKGLYIINGKAVLVK
ncbi:MAG: carboxypeptidase-like regulatory domain-containing protein [Muribaculaceae bacterium]|nr:carboxypeptidase-like regulatory domain-containing protein [Muribaculaceae bacterium]